MVDLLLREYKYKVNQEIFVFEGKLTMMITRCEIYDDIYLHFSL